MENVVNTNEELTLGTIDLLKRCENIKKNIIKSMSIGSNGIIEGINLFEGVLRNFDPEYIDENKINELRDLVDYILINNCEKRQKIDNYVYVGINMCFMMLGCYLGLENYSKKRVRELL